MKTLVSILACVLGLSLSGCASPPVNYYRLDTAGAAAPAVPGLPRVQIGPVTVPPWLDRPQLVLDDGSGRVRVLDASHWAAPLPRMVAAALARAVGRSLGDTRVEAWPSASAVPADWRVLLDIRALQAHPGVGVHLDAAWQIEHNGRSVAAGSFVTDTAAGRDVGSLVDAHDAALQALADRMAASLRAALR